MNDKMTCSATVRGSGWGRSSPCTRAAKVERGGKGYCRQHDPVAKQERDTKRHADWNDRWARKEAQWKLEGALADAGKALADYDGDDLPLALVEARDAVRAARAVLDAPRSR